MAGLMPELTRRPSAYASQHIVHRSFSPACCIAAPPSECGPSGNIRMASQPEASSNPPKLLVGPPRAIGDRVARKQGRCAVRSGRTVGEAAQRREGVAEAEAARSLLEVERARVHVAARVDDLREDRLGDSRHRHQHALAQVGSGRVEASHAEDDVGPAAPAVRRLLRLPQRRAGRPVHASVRRACGARRPVEGCRARLPDAEPHGELPLQL
eukprot:5311682-Prymnesium_polylepis.1